MRRLRWCLLPLMLLLAGCSVYGVAIPPTSGPWLAITPGTGLPGTVLTVTGGRVATASDHRLVVCWNGCRRGLRVLVQGRPGGANQAAFSATLAVPSVPWLEEGGPHAVTSGAYAVSAACVASGDSCDQASGYARAVFNLLIKVPDPACTEGHPCLQLTLAGAPRPGGTSRLTGWAPLTSGSLGPGGYALAASQGGQGVLGRWGPPPRGQLTVLGHLSQTWQGRLLGQVRWPSWAGSGPITLWLVSPRFPDGQRLAVAALVVSPTAPSLP